MHWFHCPRACIHTGPNANLDNKKLFNTRVRCGLWFIASSIFSCCSKRLQTNKNDDKVRQVFNSFWIIYAIHLSYSRNILLSSIYYPNFVFATSEFKNIANSKIFAIPDHVRSFYFDTVREPFFCQRMTSSEKNRTRKKANNKKSG